MTADWGETLWASLPVPAILLDAARLAGVYLVSLHRERTVVFGQIVTAVVFLACSIAFIPYWYSMGAAWGTLLGASSGCGLLIWQAYQAVRDVNREQPLPT